MIFLDDIHWADEASLDLLKSLVTDSDNKGTFLGNLPGQRNASASRFLKMVSELDKEKVRVTDIKLGTFEEDGVSDMLADILMFDSDEMRSLSSLICSQFLYPGVSALLEGNWLAIFRLESRALDMGP